LSYLLTGMRKIPRFSRDQANDVGIQQEDSNWYPNYAEVCDKLDAAIKLLPLSSLRKLQDAFSLIDSEQLHASFKKIIEEAIKSPVNTTTEKMEQDTFYSQPGSSHHTTFSNAPNNAFVTDSTQIVSPPNSTTYTPQNQ
jgi:hypothetical protein